MKKRLAAALAFGLAAGVLHFVFLNSVEAGAKGGEPVEVLAAGAALEKGTHVSEDRIAVVSVPSILYDGRAIPAKKVRDVLGLPVAVDLEQGQRLQWSDFRKLEDSGARDLAALVGAGERAMTIPVDSSLAMGGMLAPGHRVDILGTFSKGKDLRKDKVTVTLLQNVTVLATGTTTVDSRHGEKVEKERFTTATLSVGLEEAQLLAFAATQGRLAVVLRGYQDLEIVHDIPEKGMNDVWEAEKRNALQRNKKERSIERLVSR